jgi:outer membrane protein OmpA-like peptidoglycan-associated protein/tetratricopeptide (TPR) repeat protein
VFLLNSLFCYTQPIQEVITDHKRSSYHKFAVDLYARGLYFEAIPYFETVINKKRHPTPEMRWKLANCYRQSRMYQKASQVYEMIAKDDFTSFPLAVLWWARMEQSSGNYQEAMKHYQRFFKIYKGNASDTLRKAFAMKNSCQFALKYSHNNQKETTVNLLPDQINGAYTSFGGCLMDRSFWFTRTISRNVKREIELPAGKGRYTNEYINRVFIAFFEEGKWSKSGMVTIKGIAPQTDVFAPWMALNRKRMFYSMGNRQKETVAIYFSQIMTNDSLTAPELLRMPTDLQFTSVKHPMVTLVNGKHVMFFAGKVAGNPRGYDIYFGEITGSQDELIHVQPAGATINTSQDEISPYYDMQGQKLYFSSEGHQGMGNFDVFVAKGVPGKDWNIPQNMQIPVNSGADDIFYVPKSGLEQSFGLVTSNRSHPGHSSHYDKLYQVIQQQAPLQLLNALPDSSGKPLKAGDKLVFTNIYFERDEATLQPSSFKALDRIALFLEDHPSISFEVAGHTDSTGTWAYNKKLSVERAKRVIEYLVNKGIAKERLVPKGYSYSEPLYQGRNDSPAKRNRRVEFIIRIQN